MIIPSRQRTLPIALAAAAAMGGAVAALHYHGLGLTLSHYDARGHLVVARRIVDSLTPGWQQIGAVWLPLPHLLNALPVQIDMFYRTGASAVALSIAAFAVATGAIAWIVLQQTQSSAGAVVAAAVFALNPNFLYLQATPMTEPLLLALTTLSVACLLEWTDGGRRSAGRCSHRAGVRARMHDPIRGMARDARVMAGRVALATRRFPDDRVTTRDADHISRDRRHGVRDLQPRRDGEWFASGFPVQ